MDTLASLAQGLAVAAQPMNLLFALIGVLLGTAVGVLPGIGPAMTVALLLPVTYNLEPAGAFLMFSGIYYARMCSGSFVAGALGTALLAAFAPVVSEFAVELGAPSYFALMMLAFVAVTAVLGAS